MQETQVPSLGQIELLEKEMATHSSILAWKIPWTRGAWWATVHGVTESDRTEHACAPCTMHYANSGEQNRNSSCSKKGVAKSERQARDICYNETILPNIGCDFRIL